MNWPSLTVAEIEEAERRLRAGGDLSQAAADRILLAIRDERRVGVMNAEVDERMRQRAIRYRRWGFGR